MSEQRKTGVNARHTLSHSERARGRAHGQPQKRSDCRICGAPLVGQRVVRLGVISAPGTGQRPGGSPSIRRSERSAAAAELSRGEQSSAAIPEAGFAPEKQGQSEAAQPCTRQPRLSLRCIPSRAAAALLLPLQPLLPSEIYCPFLGGASLWLSFLLIFFLGGGRERGGGGVNPLPRVGVMKWGVSWTVLRCTCLDSWWI